MNIAILRGRLTADPELRHTESGTAVTSFTLAVDRPYSKDGERLADCITVVAWRQAAEFAAKYFRKGQMMIVEGSIQSRRWEDKNGTKRTSVEVIANHIEFGEGKREEPSVERPTSSASFGGTFPSKGKAEQEEALPDDGDLPF